MDCVHSKGHLCPTKELIIQKEINVNIVNFLIGSKGSLVSRGICIRALAYVRLRHANSFTVAYTITHGRFLQAHN